MYKTLRNTDVKDKTVLLRCDFNVPMKDGKILDDSKIKESIPTIEYLINQNCKIIILSHLGKVTNRGDKTRLSLEPIYQRLRQLLKKEIYFSRQTRSINLYMQVQSMLHKDVLLLENCRFEDLNGNLESGCDTQLAMYWSSLCDIFVMDAFGVAHRKHASTYGVSKYVPSCIGFLVEKEIAALNQFIINAKRPFTVVMGGAKLEDKIALIESFLDKCDNLLLTGGIANTFLKVLGVNVGSSLVAKKPEVYDQVKNLLLNYRDKISLPLDVIVANTYNDDYVRYKKLTDIEDDDVIYDCGNKTLEKYSGILQESETIFVNGTIGKYEDVRFSNGTKEFLSILSKLDKTIVFGGGDSVSAVNTLGYSDKFTYLSSGGGATLEYIRSQDLVGLSGIDEE